jgi:molecular chaperone Hsp31 and glyoxalase 3
MFKSLFGIAPQQEPDGSFRPSKLALKIATSDVTDYKPVSFDSCKGPRTKVMVLFTEQKNMTMKNGRAFSTGNHPVEALVPMLHLRNAGFAFEIVTPTGNSVVFEKWAMPSKDAEVMGLYRSLASRFESPSSLVDMVEALPGLSDSYAAVFIPGGHGAMLGIPDDPHVGALLRWAHAQDLFTISICHGPGALLATCLEDYDFLYSGYEMAVFPDSVDKQTPMIGYLPGHMPWQLSAKLEELGATIVNKKGDDTVCVDRALITGASPNASDNLGKVAAKALLERFHSA